MIDSHELLQSADRDAQQSKSWRAGARRKPAHAATGSQHAAGNSTEARLIRDLVKRFAIDDDGIATILALIEQVGAMRQMLRALLATVMRLPRPLRARLLAEITGRNSTPRRSRCRRQGRAVSRASPDRASARLP